MLSKIQQLLVTGLGGTVIGFIAAATLAVFFVGGTYLVLGPLGFLISDPSLPDRFLDVIAPATPTGKIVWFLLICLFVANGGAWYRSRELEDQAGQERLREIAREDEQRAAEILSGARKIGEFGPLRPKKGKSADAP